MELMSHWPCGDLRWTSKRDLPELDAVIHFAQCEWCDTMETQQPTMGDKQHG